LQTIRHPRGSGDLLRLLLAVSARTVLATAVALVLWAVLPAALGWHVTTVVSDSMSPAIRTGDVVAAMPSDDREPAIGRVLLVDDPDHADRLRLHRLEDVEDDGTLRLRGDANPVADSSPVDPEHVLGIGVRRVPWIGLPGTWVRSGAWLDLAAALAVATALVAAVRLDRPLRAGEPCSICGVPRWGLRTTVDLPDGPGRPERASQTATVRAGAVALGAVVVVALLARAGTAAGAGFVGDTGSTARAASSEAFPCFAKPTDGAALAWDFDDRGPGVRDDSGSGQHGSVTGTVTRVGGVCGEDPYVSFDTAANDPRIMADRQVAAPTTYTIEAWVRTTRAAGSIMSFGSERSAASGYKDRRFYVSTGGTAVFGTSSSGFNFTVASAARIDDGRWHHLVGTFGDSRMTLYVDGVAQGSRSDNTAPLRYAGWWRVGRESVGGWPYQTDPVFTGDVDTVRVYERVLDAGTVADHHARGR
jgi:signal peptidase I